MAGLAAAWRAPRTDPRRAAFLLWGTLGLVHALVFSLMGGIVHPYYAVALAPALAALAGGGVVELWRARSRTAAASVALGAMVLATAVVAWQLLERTPGFWPGLGLGVLFVGCAAALLLVGTALIADERAPRVARVALVVGLLTMLAGPAVYSAETMGRAISGGDPSPGPAPRGSARSAASVALRRASPAIRAARPRRARLVARRAPGRRDLAGRRQLARTRPARSSSRPASR